MNQYWHSGSEELTTEALRARLSELPDDWWIHPTEYGWRARAPEIAPSRPPTLSEADLSTILTWGRAANREEQLSDHEDVIFSKVEAVCRERERIENAQEDRCECLCHRGKQCDHPVTQLEPMCPHCGRRAAI